MADINQYFFDLIFRSSHKNFFLDDFCIFLSQYLPYFLVLGFLFLVFLQKGWRLRFLLFAEGALAVILSRGILTEVIRFFYHRMRPFDVLSFTPLVAESGFSFPSGHAAFFFALAMVAFYWNRKMGFWYFALASVNGLARIYAGVHWPLDILGGAALGILCGMFIHRLLQPYLEKISVAKPDETIPA